MLRRAVDLAEAGRRRAHARARERSTSAWLRGAADEPDADDGEQERPPLVTQGGRSPRPERPTTDERKWMRTGRV
jgi:hypothetical protein